MTTPSTTLAGCGFCDNRLPADGDLQGWTARNLATDLRWRVGGATAVTMPAATFAVCPPCEVLILTEDVATFADDDLRRAVAYGLPEVAHGVYRSEMAAYYVAFLAAIGDPVPLAEALA